MWLLLACFVVNAADRHDVLHRQQVITAPIQLLFLQMHINRKSVNANVAMYALHVLLNSIIVPQDMKSYTSK